jgi:TolA-binding protein
MMSKFKVGDRVSYKLKGKVDKIGTNGHITLYNEYGTIRVEVKEKQCRKLVKKKKVEPTIDFESQLRYQNGSENNSCLVAEKRLDDLSLNFDTLEQKIKELENYSKSNFSRLDNFVNKLDHVLLNMGHQPFLKDINDKIKELKKISNHYCKMQTEMHLRISDLQRSHDRMNDVVSQLWANRKSQIEENSKISKRLDEIEQRLPKKEECQHDRAQIGTYLKDFHYYCSLCHMKIL